MYRIRSCISFLVLHGIFIGLQNQHLSLLEKTIGTILDNDLTIPVGFSDEGNGETFLNGLLRWKEEIVDGRQEELRYEAQLRRLEEEEQEEFEEFKSEWEGKNPTLSNDCSGKNLIQTLFNENDSDNESSSEEENVDVDSRKEERKERSGWNKKT